MNTPLRRRAFLGLSATVLVPGWLCAQDADRPCRERLPRPERLPVTAAWLLARRKGRPLLAIVAPKQPTLRKVAQEAWSHALNFGSDELLADLALCEVAAGTIEDLRNQLPPSVELPEKIVPLAFLIETDTRKVVPIDPQLIEVNEPFFVSADEERELRKLIRKRVAQIAVALRIAIAKNPAMLERRRALEERKIGRPDRDHVDSLPALALAPAHSRVWAQAAGEDRDRAMHTIAEAARTFLCVGAPRGATWNRYSSMCSAGPCGVGHVPAVSKRFLGFLTQEDC